VVAAEDADLSQVEQHAFCSARNASAALSSGFARTSASET
jgi:hypothetical protein